MKTSRFDVTTNLECEDGDDSPEEECDDVFCMECKESVAWRDDPRDQDPQLWLCDICVYEVLLRTIRERDEARLIAKQACALLEADGHEADYLSMHWENESSSATAAIWRTAWNAAIEAAVLKTPGGNTCDPQQVADDIRTLMEPHSIIHPPVDHNQ